MVATVGGRMTRYEFLTALHELLQPGTYLEVGVQYGWSLQLATRSRTVIGIDPAPQVRVKIPDGSRIYAMTSDTFFDPGIGHAGEIGASVDLAFIDGMHLYEYALRDFINIERHCHPGAVIVFDDALPTTQAMAAREPCPGDWTGDVWRVEPILRYWRPELHLTLVDTFPTGLLLVRGLDPADSRLARHLPEIVHAHPRRDAPVPDQVLRRAGATAADLALTDLEEWSTQL